MPENEGNKLNRVEEMKNRLFTKSYETRIRQPNVFSPLPDQKVRDSWEQAPVAAPQGEKFFMRTSVFKKFFIFSILFFIGAVSYASYMFFVGGNTVSNDNIDISVQGNTFTAGGEDLPLIVEITNRNNSPLDLVDLIVEYPRSSSTAAGGDTERTRESLGTIPAGGVRSENLKVVLFGEQGSNRTIKFSIEYRVEGSNAIFVKEKTYDVAINSSPINLTFNAPLKVSSNQDMTLNIKAALNANKVVSQVVLKVDYPLGFEFTSATPAPTLGNNIWSLDDLAPGAERNIAIIGKMVDASDGEQKVFRVWSGTQASNDKSNIGVVFNSLSSVVAIEKPSIEAKLYINGSYAREYSNNSKNKISGEIRWVNNMDTIITDMEISAKLSGSALDRKAVKSDQGFYNSSIDTIVWDKTSQRDFARVDPGESGVVTFSLSPNTFVSTGGSFTQPSINVNINISGRQAADGFTFNDINSSEIKTIKITSDVGFAAKALYYSGVFKNTGSIPPKAEKPTTYTIVWSLSNTSSNISKAQVRATLPAWVSYAGSFSPKSEDISFSAGNREILWNVGNLSKGAGITGTDREASFQITFTPSLSQVNSIPVLVNEAVLTGHDDFANVDVSVSKPSLNTRLVNEATFPNKGEVVTE